MNPEEILKREIILSVNELDLEDYPVNFDRELVRRSIKVNDSDYINKLWGDLSEFFSEYPDYIPEFRTSGTETQLEPQKRHYLYHGKELAVPVTDSEDWWVGWTCWYGGGKHGEPDAMDWIDSAYLVQMRKEMREVLVFKRLST